MLHYYNEPYKLAVFPSQYFAFEAIGSSPEVLPIVVPIRDLCLFQCVKFGE